MDREYDIVVFGATGYTGKLTAQAIARSLPTDIKWAVAGRRYEKLESVVAQCKSVNSDRIQPAIEVCNLDDKELADLAKKTRIMVSTVGPYSIHGEPAFKACAENGTHYFDVTGEVAFIKKMIDKYESVAKSTGAIMIPQIGVESAPADLITWALVSKIRQELSVATAEVVLSLHDLSGTPSGGTLATVLALNEQFSPSELFACSKPYALSPIPGPKAKSSASWLGSRTVPDLGMLTTSFTGVVDKPCVQRSWGLLGGPKLYGPNFNLECMMRTRNYLTGVITHFALFAVAVGLALAPFRWLARKFVIEAGQGASEEDMKNERCEYRALATPDLPGETKRAFAKVVYRGSMYQLTGIFLAQACLTLLKDESVASKSGGGVLTPATLGQSFIGRLAGEGFAIETQMLDR